MSSQNKLYLKTKAMSDTIPGSCQFCKTCPNMHADVSGTSIICKCRSQTHMNKFGQPSGQDQRIYFKKNPKMKMVNGKRKFSKGKLLQMSDELMSNQRHKNRVASAAATGGSDSALSPTDGYFHKTQPAAGMAAVRCDHVHTFMRSLSSIPHGSRQHRQIKPVAYPNMVHWHDMHGARQRFRDRAQARARREAAAARFAEPAEGTHEMVLRDSPGTRTRANKRQFHCDCELSHTHSGKCYSFAWTGQDDDGGK